jgi:hypothetical protein
MLPWQSALSASFPMLVHLFTTHGQPHLSFVLTKRHESWIRVVLLPGLSFEHKETTETHSDLNKSPER